MKPWRMTGLDSEIGSTKGRAPPTVPLVPLTVMPTHPGSMEMIRPSSGRPLSRRGKLIRDGVGFQLRVWMDGDTVGTWQKQKIDTFLDNLDKSVKRYADLGLLVEFSEVEVGIRVDDIDLSTPAGQKTYEKRLAAQAKVYGGLAKIALENKNVAAFIIWMVSDRYPQGAVAPGYGDTSLLDAEFKPKPAYYAILDELKKP